MNSNKHKNILMSSPLGYAYHKIILDDNEKPIDYEFIEVNPSFEKLTGLNKSDLINNKVTTILPGIRSGEFDFVVYYGDIAINGGEKEIVQYVDNLKKWYKIDVYSPEKYHFVTFFTDITKEIEQQSILLSSLLDSIPDIIFFKDINGVYLGCNNKFELFVGAKKDKIISHTDYDLFNKDLADLFRMNDKAMLEIGRPRKNEEWVNYPDGTQILLDTFKAPLLDENRNTFGIIGISRDITKRYEMEKTIKNERDLFIQGPTVVFKWKEIKGWPIEYVSENVKDVLGYSREELILEQPSYLKLLYPDDIERVCEDVAERTKNNFNYFSHKPYRLIKKSGDIAWVKDYTTVIRNNLGVVTHYHGYIIDITTQISLQEEIENQKNRLERIIEGTNAGTWEWNIPTGKIIYNYRWAELIGYTLSELEPANINKWMKLIHPEDLNRSKKLLQKHFKGEINYYEFEYRMKHKNGEWIWILNRGKVIEWDKNDKPINMFGTIMDISARKNVEKSLKKSQELLELFFSQSIDGCFFMMLDEPFQWDYSVDNEKSLKSVFYNLKVTRVNKAFLNQYSAREKDFLGLTLNDFYERYIKNDKEEWTELFNKGHVHINRIDYKLDNTKMFIEGDYICLYDDNNIIGFFGVQRDITYEKEAQKKLKELSIRDPLTNIYNRRYIFDRLQNIISTDKKDGIVFSIAIIDIDYFKNINDSYGHLAGDFILKEFSKILQCNIRPFDLLGRFGGEEFIIIFVDVTKEKSFSITERILNIIREKQFVYNNQVIKFTFSCGIADIYEINEIDKTSENIISISDERMYKAKKSGRNKIVIL